MAVKVRLARVGRKKLPFYRIVAIDSRQARDGEALEILGTYDALRGEIVTINMAGIEKWVKQGAQLAQSVGKIVKMARRNAASKAVVSEDSVATQG